MTLLTELGDLTVADVMHPSLSTLPATATIGEVRDYFAVSTSRRLALLAADGRYAGSIQRDALPDDAEAAGPAAAHATSGPTVAPDAPATVGRDLALAADSRRLPVVDADGVLVGIVAIDQHRVRFCG